VLTQIENKSRLLGRLLCYRFLMASVIMSIGVPGSGKSTVMQKIAAWGSFEITGPDAIRLEKHNDETNHADDQAIWDELRSRVTAALKAGKTIVIDSTFHTKQRRAHFLGFARANGAAKIEALSFDIPLETLLSRASGRHESGGKAVSEAYIQQAYTELQDNLPSPEEGFDELFRIDGGGNVITIKTQADGILSRFFKHLTNN
jgi:predicted kinase